MNKDELKARVDKIIALARDNEVAHSEEDKLHLELLRFYLRPDLIAEIDRLSEANFLRWYE